MIATYLVVICNHCGARFETPVQHNHRKARTLARKRGWTCIRHVGDWCPRHDNHAPEPRPRARGRVRRSG